MHIAFMFCTCEPQPRWERVRGWGRVRGWERVQGQGGCKELAAFRQPVSGGPYKPSGAVRVRGGGKG